MMTVSGWPNGATRLLLAVCGALLASCAKCDDYRYFDFGVTPGIAVIETRVPPLAGLKDVEPFPVLYGIERKTYRIFIRADQKAYGPTATLSLNSSTEGMTLKVITSPAENDGRNCLSKSEHNGDLSFFWLDWKGCAAQQVIGVGVIDSAGAQVAVEELSLNVIANGSYCVKDVP